MDDYYPVEIRLASKNGWFTPAEAQAYYGRFSRQGLTVHWWNTPALAGTHDGTVDYMLQGALNAAKSVNYVVSNGKITMLVNPNDVAWASQGGNPTTISVEFDPRLNDEGYKRAGWLVEQLEQRFGHELQLYPHRYWFSTDCPGNLSLDRIRQEADRWARGEYTNPQPPAPASDGNPHIEYHDYDEVRKYVVNKGGGADIWDFGKKGWNFDKRGHINEGEPFNAVGYAVHENGATYVMTEYSYNVSPRRTVGVNINDVQQYIPMQPAPPEPIPPSAEAPAEPEKPEWIKNLRDIDDTPYWLKSSVTLTDITTGKPAVKPDGSMIFLMKDEGFIGSAVTKVGDVEYRVTDYSFKKGIFNGVPLSALTLTKPGVPDVAPVPNFPTPEETKSFLQRLLSLITEFLAKFK